MKNLIAWLSFAFVLCGCNLTPDALLGGSPGGGGKPPPGGVAVVTPDQCWQRFMGKTTITGSGGLGCSNPDRLADIIIDWKLGEDFKLHLKLMPLADKQYVKLVKILFRGASTTKVVLRALRCAPGTPQEEPSGVRNIDCSLVKEGNEDDKLVYVLDGVELKNETCDSGAIYAAQYTSEGCVQWSNTYTHFNYEVYADRQVPRLAPIIP